MVSIITAWGVQWTGLPHSPKPDSNRLMKDNRECYECYEHYIYLLGTTVDLQLLSVTLGFGIGCDIVIWANGIVWHSIKYATKCCHL